MSVTAYLFEDIVVSETLRRNVQPKRLSNRNELLCKTKFWEQRYRTSYCKYETDK
jgi:hypothetical protein